MSTTGQFVTFPGSPFELHQPFAPAGDQPTAIAQLVDGLRQGESFQTLLGVTGSGKTFTMANVIAQLNKPTLILSHNKTLAAQLYGEFKNFFPLNFPFMKLSKLRCTVRFHKEWAFTAQDSSHAR